MKAGIGLLLLMVGVSVTVVGQKEAPPPACLDEEAMAADYRKTLTELVGNVKKESLEEFQRTFHRKSCLTKLTLSVGIMEGAAACFERAAQDPSTPKKQAAAYKAKQDTYVKMRDRVGQYRDSLKGTESEKEAKALIEEMDLAE